MSIRLRYVSTDWTQLEQILNVSGPKSLADYLAERYVTILVQEFHKYDPKLVEDEIHTLVSEVFYDLLKNDHRELKKIHRNKGRFRGLLFRHIRCKMYLLEQKKQRETRLLDKISQSLEDNPPTTAMLEIIYDVQKVLNALQIIYPNLYVAIQGHYFEDKSLKILAEELQITENAVKQRLYVGRQWLESALRDYKTN